MSGRSFFGAGQFGAAEVGGSRLMQALVVDDSAVYRKLIGDCLRSWGFGVTLAETGSEAWRILEQPDAPKLVLLDWVLPDLDGIELCQRIRQAGSSGPYPALFVKSDPVKNLWSFLGRARPYATKGRLRVEMGADSEVVSKVRDQILTCEETRRVGARRGPFSGRGWGLSRWEQPSVKRDDGNYPDPEKIAAGGAQSDAPRPRPERPALGSVRARSRLAPGRGGSVPGEGASPASAHTPPPSALPGTCSPRSWSNWSVRSACRRAIL